MRVRLSLSTGHMSHKYAQLYLYMCVAQHSEYFICVVQVSCCFYQSYVEINFFTHIRARTYAYLYNYIYTKALASVRECKCSHTHICLYVHSTSKRTHTHIHAVALTSSKKTRTFVFDLEVQSNKSRIPTVGNSRVTFFVFFRADSSSRRQ